MSPGASPRLTGVRRARELEQLYLRMWARNSQGLPPEHLASEHVSSKHLPSKHPVCTKELPSVLPLQLSSRLLQTSLRIESLMICVNASSRLASSDA